jgi:hypothetical protein
MPSTLQEFVSKNDRKPVRRVLYEFFFTERHLHVLLLLLLGVYVLNTKLTYEIFLNQSQTLGSNVERIFELKAAFFTKLSFSEQSYVAMRLYMGPNYPDLTPSQSFDVQNLFASLERIRRNVETVSGSSRKTFFSTMYQISGRSVISPSLWIMERLYEVLYPSSLLTHFDHMKELPIMDDFMEGRLHVQPVEPRDNSFVENMKDGVLTFFERFIKPLYAAETESTSIATLSTETSLQTLKQSITRDIQRSWAGYNTLMYTAASSYITRLSTEYQIVADQIETVLKPELWQTIFKTTATLPSDVLLFLCLWKLLLCISHFRFFAK